MTTSKRVVIVGAGPGGLCAAMLLQARGFSVTLVEKEGEVGGRSGALHVGDYTFDVGSTMLMMPFVLEEMFELAGTRLRDEIALVALDPMYRLDFNGRALDVSADPRRMTQELERFAPGSGKGLERFLTRERERLLHLYPVLQHTWPSMAGMITPDVIAALPHIGLGRSLHDTASDYFDDPALQLGFSFQSAYLGMSPWNCPGGFGMVPYVEHAWGLYHVRGGINQLCEAMARVARTKGARILTGTRVARLVVAGERCTGVELQDGTHIEADDVIIDADATAALLSLIDRDVSVRFSKRRLAQMHESCSTFMLYLGLDTSVPLAHHTFFFANDYAAEMDRVFESGTLGEDFSLYVCNPSRSDPTMAPGGHSSLYALALVPNTKAALDWAREAPRMRARVLAQLSKRVGFPIADHIRAEQSLTPRDWQESYEVSHGAVFGPRHELFQLLAFRLPNQLPSPNNVFLAGGGTSPGSGLPTILESARIAARLLCERHEMPFPKSQPLPAPRHWHPDAAVSEQSFAHR